MSEYTQEFIDEFREKLRTYKESGSRSINDLLLDFNSTIV